MTDERFSQLCRSAVLYTLTQPTAEVIARGGVAKNGAHWIVTLDGFHVLATGNLTEKAITGGVTWYHGATPVYTVMELVACEEVTQGDAVAAIEARRDEMAGATGSAWFRQQIAGAAAAGPPQLTWHPPAPPAENSP